jgi:hypothetical protein
MDFYSAQADAWQMADDLAEPIVILAGPDGYHAATEDEAARWMEDPDYTRADFVDVKPSDREAQ